jgi:hypothetical protein
MKAPFQRAILMAMKSLCTTLLLLLLSPVVFAQAPITGKLVKIVLGNSESNAEIVSKILDLSPRPSVTVEEKSEKSSGSSQSTAESSTNISISDSGYPNTLYLIIEADGIRYFCSQFARRTSDLHSGNWLIGGTVTLKIHSDNAEIRSSDGYTAKAKILKKELIKP